MESRPPATWYFAACHFLNHIEFKSILENVFKVRTQILEDFGRCAIHANTEIEQLVTLEARLSFCEFPTSFHMPWWTLQQLVYGVVVLGSSLYRFPCPEQQSSKYKGSCLNLSACLAFRKDKLGGESRGNMCGQRPMYMQACCFLAQLQASRYSSTQVWTCYRTMIDKVVELDYQHLPTPQLATRSRAKYCQAPRIQQRSAGRFTAILQYPTNSYNIHACLFLCNMEFLADGDRGNLTSRLVGAGASRRDWLQYLYLSSQNPKLSKS